MNSLLEKIIIRFILQPKSKWKADDQVYSPYDIAKGFRELKLLVQNFFRDTGMIIVGIFAGRIRTERFFIVQWIY
jgi:hypothetical protein